MALLYCERILTWKIINVIEKDTRDKVEPWLSTIQLDVRLSIEIFFCMWNVWNKKHSVGSWCSLKTAILLRTTMRHVFSKHRKNLRKITNDVQRKE